MNIPEPIEIPYRPGGHLRGLLRAGEGATVILFHDVGTDVDAWGTLPVSLAEHGYRVIAFDLPGHGLSDDLWEPDQVHETIATVIEWAREHSHGPLFAASMGTISPVVGAMSIDAHVALSPMPDPAWTREETRSPCLIFVGGADPHAAGAADRYFRGRLGYSVVSSFGVRENGAGLLRGTWSRHLHEQTLAFLRDYAG